MRDWIVKRGVLFLLLQMPIAALLAGFLLRVVTLPIATFAVFVSFAVFTVWVSYRGSVSDDPDEPVHHLHRYALYALLPFVMFSLARIPMFFADGIVYWQLWYAFGAQLTGEPGTQLATLAAGMVMYTLQGMGLAMCYYVLFRRHNLANALLFLGTLLPALFLFIFPVFSLPGLKPGAVWYVTHWLAHVVMAVTAWAMPMFWTRVWSAVRRGIRVAVVAGFIMVLLAPYGFAVERAANWQFGEQRRIDEAAFDRVTVKQDGELVLAGAARYTFKLSIDRGIYTNAAGVRRVVDAGPVDVKGQLVSDGKTIAWCSGHIRVQTSPNTIRDPEAFAAAVRQLRPVEVPVNCAGSAAVSCATGVTARWVANASLAGDRAKQRREYAGQATLTCP